VPIAWPTISMSSCRVRKTVMSSAYAITAILCPPLPSFTPVNLCSRVLGAVVDWVCREPCWSCSPVGWRSVWGCDRPWCH
jgi:hypothetical protein